MNQLFQRRRLRRLRLRYVQTKGGDSVRQLTKCYRTGVTFTFLESFQLVFAQYQFSDVELGLVFQA